MKIALITEPLSGGVGRIVCDLAVGLASRGHHVTLFFSPDRVKSSFLARVGAHPSVKLVPLPLGRVVSLRDVWASMILAWRVWENGPFDVVHAHSSKAGALTRIVLFFSRFVLYSPHAPITLDPTLGRWTRWIYTAVETFLGRFSAGQVVACSTHEAAHLASIGVPPGKIRIVPNGTRVETNACHIDARQIHGLAPHDLCVGFVGRFVSQKRPDRFVSVVKALKERVGDAKAVMVGTSECEREVREMIASEGLDDTIRVVTTTDAREELAALDVLCITSTYEGFSVAMLEALGLGVPVVSTAVGGADYALRGDECGSVVESFDPSVFAERIVALTMEDAARVSASCYARYLSDFTEQRMLDGIEAVYREAAVRLPGRRQAINAWRVGVLALAVLATDAYPARTGDGVSVMPDLLVQSQEGMR